jgi:hypothetical protein
MVEKILNTSTFKVISTYSSVSLALIAANLIYNVKKEVKTDGPVNDFKYPATCFVSYTS